MIVAAYGFLSGVGTILAVVGAVGVAYAVFRTNAVGHTIMLYKSENEILAGSVTRQEKETAQLKAQMAELTRTNEVLKKTIGTAATVAELDVISRRFEAALDSILEVVKSSEATSQRLALLLAQVNLSHDQDPGS